MASARAPLTLRFQPDAAMPTQTAVSERIESAMTCESEPASNGHVAKLQWTLA